MKIPYDKKLHFRCGCIIALLIGLYDPILGLSTGVVAGVAKEVYDYFDYGLLDTKDMLFTWAGAAIGTCLCMIAQIKSYERR
jgi:hypothetical protein